MTDTTTLEILPPIPDGKLEDLEILKVRLDSLISAIKSGYAHTSVYHLERVRNMAPKALSLIPPLDNNQTRSRLRSLFEKTSTEEQGYVAFSSLANKLEPQSVQIRGTFLIGELAKRLVW